MWPGQNNCQKRLKKLRKRSGSTTLSNDQKRKIIMNAITPDGAPQSEPQAPRGDFYLENLRRFQNGGNNMLWEKAPPPPSKK